MSRANRPAQDSKGDSKIARERSVNVSGASVKNKVAANRAVVNRAAANKVAANRADDKTGSFETTKRRKVILAALLFTSKGVAKGVIILLCQKNK